MRKLLYLHGLNSTLHTDRRQALEKYNVEIFAPQIDYENEPTALGRLLREYKDIDMIVGSSAGGLAGYYLSNLLDVPALLFNPALPFRDYLPQIPDFPHRSSLLQVVIGARDDVVNPQKSLEILQSEKKIQGTLEVHWISSMEHSLPIGIFEKEFASFFKEIPRN